MKLLITLTLFTFSATSMFARKLPNYFPICKFEDSELGQCVGDGANVVITRLVKGNEYFNLPPLSEFKIGDVHSPVDSPFKLELVDGIAGKLEDIRYIFSKFDRQTKAATATAFFPELQVNGTYELDGAVEGVSVSGKGFANIKFEDVYCRLHWNLTVFEKEGTRFLDTSGLTVTYDIKNAIYSFSNLFDDDVVLGEKVSQHLNKYWQILAKVIAPVVMQSFSDVALRIGKAVPLGVPLTNIFQY